MFNNAQLHKKHPIQELTYNTIAHSEVLKHVDISHLKLLTMSLEKLGYWENSSMQNKIIFGILNIH
jgi:hypothetical protein